MSHTVFTQQDKQDAKALQQDYLRRYEDEPIFLSARRTLDRAERRKTDDELDALKKLSVAERQQRAKQRLRSHLDGIRSTGDHFYQETVPTAPGEISLRALVSADMATAVLGEPKTRINVDVRPHNDASFESRRKVFLDGIDLPHGVESVSAAARFRIEAADGTSLSEVQEAVNFARGIIQEIEAPITLAIETDPSNSKRRFVIVHVFQPEKDDGDADPVRGFVSEFLRGFMSRRMAEHMVHGGQSKDGSSSEGLPALFRLATMRFELPQSIGEWLAEHGAGPTTQDASWASLLEGMRCAVEVIAKDRFTALAREELAEAVLAMSSGEDLEFPVEMLLPLLAARMQRETSVHLRLAPPELVAAQSVRGIGQVWRAIFKRIGAKVDDDAGMELLEKGGGEAMEHTITKDGYADDEEEDAHEFSRDAVQQILATTAPEDLVATMLFDWSMMGVSAHQIRRMLLLLPFGDLVTKSEERSKLPMEALRHVRTCFGALTSIDILARGAEIRVHDLRGIDHDLLAYLPEDFDICVESLTQFIKPLALSGFVESGDIEKDAPERLGDINLNSGFESLKWSQMPFYAALTKAIGRDGVISTRSSFVHELAAVAQLPRQRTATADGSEPPSAAWDFPQAGDRKAATTMSDNSWLRDAFQEFFAIRAEQHDCKEAAASSDAVFGAAAAPAVEEASPLAAVEQVSDAVAGNNVFCHSCGVSYDAAAGHTCPQQQQQQEKQQQEVVLMQGESRPLLAGHAVAATTTTTTTEAVKEEDEPVNDGGHTYKCSNCGAEVNPSIPEPHVCGGDAPEEQAEEKHGEDHVVIVGDERPRVPALHHQPSPPRGPSSSGAARPARSPYSPRAPGPGRLPFVIPTEERALRAIFDTFDVDANGAIDLAEFVTEYKTMEASMGVVVTDRDVVSNFRHFDKNHDGTLSFDEFRMFMLKRAARM